MHVMQKPVFTTGFKDDEYKMKSFLQSFLETEQ